MYSIVINGETITADMVKSISCEQPEVETTLSMFTEGGQEDSRTFEPGPVVYMKLHLHDGRVLIESRIPDKSSSGQKG